MLPWAALAAVTVFLLWVDLHFFARGREPTFREGVYWSIGWLVVSLLAGVVAARSSTPTAPTTRSPTRPSTSSSARCRSTTCSCSCCCSRTSGCRPSYRARLLFWGIAAALVLRGLAILGGVALIEQLHFVIYILGVLLLVLAYRILRGVEDNVDPDNNFVVRLVRKVFPVTRRVPRQALVRASRRGRATRRRCSSAWPRSSRPTSRSRSTRSRRRSRSRATPC